MSNEQDDGVVCYSYTAARRHPLVIGQIGGFVLPSPLSPAQMATLLASFFGLLLTRQIWGLLLPGVVSLFVLISVPCGLTWAVRHLRMEGRSPLRMLYGQLAYWLSPPQGWVRGRAVWLAPRPVRVVQRIVIVALPGEPVAPESNPVTGREPAPVVALRPLRWAALNADGGKSGAVPRPVRH
jgi:hypothetical protein